MTSRRSLRTDDGTPLAVIQEELFEIQRQRKQVTLSTPPGPPPDIPYYASVNPDHEVTSNFTNTPAISSGPVRNQNPQQPHTPTQQTRTQTQTQPQQNEKTKKKSRSAALVGLQDPMDVPYDPPLVQERLSGETVRRVKVGLLMTTILFVCLYLYPVISNVPQDKRLPALTTLIIAIVLGAICAYMWPRSSPSEETNGLEGNERQQQTIV